MRGQMRSGLAGMVVGLTILSGGWSAAHAAQFEFWFGGGASVRVAVMAECERFNRAQSRDRVRCLDLGSYQTVLQRTAAAYRAGKQPAVAEIYDIATMEMIQSGAVLPAEAFMAEEGLPIGAADYPAAVRRYYGDAKGRLYAIPFKVSTLLLYANDTMLGRAGIAHAPRDWTEFGNVLARLHRAGLRCPFSFRIDPWWWLEQTSAVAGTPVASRDNGHDGLNAVYTFAAGADRQVMADLLRWQRAGWAILYGNNALGSPQRAFAAGECALTLDSSGSAAAHARIAQGRFALSVHPMPGLAGHPRHSSLPGGAALWVLKGFDADTYRAAAAFIAFLRRPQEEADFSHATGYLPLSHDASERIAVSAPKALATRAVAVAMTSLDDPGGVSVGVRLGFYARFRAAWQEEMQRVFSGGETLGQALAAAQSRGNVLLRRFQSVYGTDG